MTQKVNFNNLTGDTLTIGNTVITGTGLTVNGSEIAGSVTSYANASLLPLTNLTAGDFAFVDANNALYFTNGSGWYLVSAVNRSPTIETFPAESEVEIPEDSNTFIMTLTANEPEGTPITWGISLDSDANTLIDSVTNYSNGVFEFTKSASPGEITSGVSTVTASDGVNVASKNISILIPVNPIITNYEELNAAGITSVDPNYPDYTLFKFVNNSYTLQTSGSEATLTVMVIGGGGAGATFYYGGGAGGGAVIYGNVSMPNDTWSFSIGAGGIGTQGLGIPAVGNPGGPTTITGLNTGLWADARGGQGGIQGWTGGQTYTGGNYNGGSGSGGGEQINNTAPSLATYAGTVPTGCVLYRNKGGDGTGSGVGGGGGGAGSAGSAGGTGTGNGGNGFQTTLFQTLEASPGASDGGRFAAGGGGVNYFTSPGSPGLGGAGLSQGNAQAVTNATNYGSAGGSNMHTAGAGGRQDAGDGFQGAVFFRVLSSDLGL